MKLTVSNRLVLSMATAIVFLFCMVSSFAQTVAEQPYDPSVNLGKVYRAKSFSSEYLDMTSPVWETAIANDHHSRDVYFNLTGGGRSQEDFMGMYNSWPTILVQLPEGWQVVDLKDGFYHFKWAHVAAAPEKGYLWGFLEWTIEGPGHEIPVVFSDDGGKTWRHVASIKKPSYLAWFHSFKMGPNGKGTVEMLLDGPPFPEIRRMFTYVTSDWGRTWKRSGRPKVSVLGDVYSSPHNDCSLHVNFLPEPLPADCRLSEDTKEQILLQLRKR
jgi:hypothetical protein